METTNNIPETLLDARRQLFSQSIGQKMWVAGKEEEITGVYKNYQNDWFASCQNTKIDGEWGTDHGAGHNIDYCCSLIKKPLGEISDEDAGIIADMVPISALYKGNDRIYRGRMYVRAMKQIKLSIADYLRSRGYALPYGPYSVEQLVEAGIYRLTPKL